MDISSEYFSSIMCNNSLLLVFSLFALLSVFYIISCSYKKYAVFLGAKPTASQIQVCHQIDNCPVVYSISLR